MSDIRNYQAYQQGKMLNHECWLKLLKGKRKPSDIDMVFDFNGRIVQVELSRKTCFWKYIPTGQLRLHKSYVQAGQGQIISIVALHEVPTMEDIITCTQIKKWQVMYWDINNNQIEYSRVFTADLVGVITALSQTDWNNLIGVDFNTSVG